MRILPIRLKFNCRDCGVIETDDAAWRVHAAGYCPVCNTDVVSGLFSRYVERNHA